MSSPGLRRLVGQGFKYGIVGVSNTVVGLGVIYLLQVVAGLHFALANALGYIAGGINSFVWNRFWTFKATHSAARRQAPGFAVVLGGSYLLQLGVLYGINALVEGTPYLSQVAATAVYTVTSFLALKLLVFRA